MRSSITSVLKVSLVAMGAIVLISDATAGWRLRGLAGKTITSIAIHPTQKDVVLVGLQEGGLHVSRDGGKTWIRSMGNQQVLCITYDRTNPEVIYAGTENGIKRSADGGHYFTDLGALKTAVVSIGLDESQTKAIIVGTRQGVYRSLDQGRSFQQAGLKEHAVTSLSIAKTNPKPTIFVGTESGGLFRSENFGMSWTASGEGIPEQSIYSVVCDLKNSNRILISTLSSGVFASDNCGATWVKVASEIRGHEGFVLTQAVDAKTNSVVLYAANFSGDALRSSDNGAQWERIGGAIGSETGLCLGIANVVPTTLYMGTMSGLYVIEEGGPK